MSDDSSQPPLLESDPFEAVVDQYLSAQCAYSPGSATYFGIHDHDMVLAEPGEAAAEAWARSLEAVLDDVRRLPPTADPRRQVDRRALAGLCTSTLIDVAEVQPWRRNPVSHLEELLWSFYVPIVRPYAPAEDRAVAVRARLSQVPEFLDRARAVIDDVPDVFAETALEMGAAIRSLLAGTIPEWGRQEAPGVPLASAAAAADAALDDHLAWLAAEHRGGRGSFAIGGERFERKVASAHALPLTTEQLVSIGEELFDRTREEMEAVARRLGRGWTDEVEAAKADHPSASALLDAYRAEAERALEFTSSHRLVALPEAALEVLATPEPVRTLIPYAAYVAPGALEKDTTGVFWVTPPDDTLSPAEAAERLRGHNRAAITVTTVHEAYPGHHLQLATAKQFPSVLGRLEASPLLIEGWAFYCEELAWEHGYYDDRTRLLQLKDQLWRAIRVVVDAKLHTGEMSVADAERALVDRAGLDQVAARAEVRRYAMMPTYATAYAMGKAAILDLRDDARTALGPRFDLRVFHDELLSYGSVPVPLVADVLASSWRRES